MQLPKLARQGHANHAGRCLQGLGSAQVEYETSRMAVGFYCIAILDVLGSVNQKLKDQEQEWVRSWVWDQQVEGEYGAGFRGSSVLQPDQGTSASAASQLARYDLPDLIMTYTALLLLSVLRDDLSCLNRDGLSKLLKACQLENGSFTVLPGESDADLRPTYCAFAIASMLDDWSGIDVPKAIDFILRCQSWEGGFGQAPLQEAVGGTTFCAVAALALAPVPQPVLSRGQHDAALRWLITKQRSDAGFCGRTNKEADACYSFWCGAALAVLGHSELVDAHRNALFLGECQFRYGGIAKAPGDHPDPFHTYMSVACLSLYPPYPGLVPNDELSEEDAVKATWSTGTFDPVLNATTETAAWARQHIPRQQR